MFRVHCRKVGNPCGSSVYVKLHINQFHRGPAWIRDTLNHPGLWLARIKPLSKAHAPPLNPSAAQRAARVYLSKLEALALSHGHLDHWGNLIPMLKSNNKKIRKGIHLYVIMTLLAILELLKSFDLIHSFVRVLAPFLRIMDLDHKVGFLWITAVVFGLSYDKQKQPPYTSYRRKQCLIKKQKYCGLNNQSLFPIPGIPVEFPF